MTNRRNFIKGLTTAGIAASVGASAGALSARLNQPGAQPSQKETSFERILRTNTLRCGYATYEPSIKVDPNTGKISGVFYDLANEIADYFGLDIEWVEETQFGTFFTGLKANRFDLFASGTWPSGGRIKSGLLSNAVRYSPAYLYVRKDDYRFPDLEAVNNPNIKIAIRENDAIEETLKLYFPHATFVPIQAMADYSQTLLDVTTGKADVTLQEPYSVQQFLKNNPNTLKQIPMHQPLRVFGNCMVTDNDDARFKIMLDAALEDLQNAGFIAELHRKHIGDPTAFLSPPPTYHNGPMY